MKNGRRYSKRAVFFLLPRRLSSEWLAPKSKATRYAWVPQHPMAESTALMRVPAGRRASEIVSHSWRSRLGSHHLTTDDSTNALPPYPRGNSVHRIPIALLFFPQFRHCLRKWGNKRLRLRRKTTSLFTIINGWTSHSHRAKSLPQREIRTLLGDSGFEGIGLASALGLPRGWMLSRWRVSRAAGLGVKKTENSATHRKVPVHDSTCRHDGHWSHWWHACCRSDNRLCLHH